MAADKYVTMTGRDQDGTIDYGPPDAWGNRIATNRNESFSAGNEFTEFRRDGVRMVRLPDGKEMKYDDYVSGCINGPISCANWQNMLF